MGLKFVIKQRPPDEGAGRKETNAEEEESLKMKEESVSVSLATNTTLATNEEEMKSEERQQEQTRGDELVAEEPPQKFNAEGVPIAYPDEYTGTSTTIITPDGITMHRTSRGAFKCGQCKYCAQPNLKQKCMYNNAMKKERDTRSSTFGRECSETSGLRRGEKISYSNVTRTTAYSNNIHRLFT